MRLALVTTALLAMMCVSEIEAATGFEHDLIRLTVLEEEVAALKGAGQPSGLPQLDTNGRVPQDALPAGYDQYSAYDLAWQALHMAAAAACRGSTASGGKGCCENTVLTRNANDAQSCSQICAAKARTCDAAVSLDGKIGKATQNGQHIGAFYNYGCNNAAAANGGSEPDAPDSDVMTSADNDYYTFCCCRKA